MGLNIIINIFPSKHIEQIYVNMLDLLFLMPNSNKTIWIIE